MGDSGSRRAMKRAGLIHDGGLEHTLFLSAHLQGCQLDGARAAIVLRRANRLCGHGALTRCKSDFARATGGYFQKRHPLQSMASDPPKATRRFQQAINRCVQCILEPRPCLFSQRQDSIRGPRGAARPYQIGTHCVCCLIHITPFPSP